MKKMLTCTFHFFTNFKIKSNIIDYSREFKKKLVHTNVNKKLCKNFITLLIFLQFLKKHFMFNGGVLMNLNFFIKPHKQNIFNYLRAPYKNKLARNQLYTPKFRFSIKVTFLKPNLPTFKKITYFTTLFKFFTCYLTSLETNILYLNKVSVSCTTLTSTYWDYHKFLKKI